MTQRRVVATAKWTYLASTAALGSRIAVKRDSRVRVMSDARLDRLHVRLRPACNTSHISFRRPLRRELRHLTVSTSAGGLPSRLCNQPMCQTRRLFSSRVRTSSSRLINSRCRRAASISPTATLPDSICVSSRTIHSGRLESSVRI